MSQQHQQPSSQERPYRSHLSPACLSCRRRKSRCKVQANAATCLSCQVHGSECIFPDQRQNPASSSSGGGTTTPARRGAVTATNQGSNSASASSSRRSRQVVVTSDVGNVKSRRGSTEISSSSSSLSPPPSKTSSVRRTSNNTNTNDNNNNNDSNIAIPSTRNPPEPIGWTNGDRAQQPTPLAVDDADQDNRHIIGPALTNDSYVLADYLSASATTNDSNRGSMRLIRTLPTSSNRCRSKPILFTAERKRPFGYPNEIASPSQMKCQIIEQILYPWLDQLIDIYFDRVNICFPLLDRASFRTQYTTAKNRISPTLLACLYAHSLVYWKSLPSTAGQPKPDGRFIWNTAIESIHSELHISPGISTVTAILINVGGRPTSTMIGNASQLGAAVSLAHSLGLNRDPLAWDIPESEKYLRMKIWWCLVVYDKWTSLAYGTPPHIQRAFHDIPAPTIHSVTLSIGSDNKFKTRNEIAAASIFIALYGLTQVLDVYLQHVYSVGSGSNNIAPETLDYRLNSWVDDLSDPSVRSIVIRGGNLDLPGAANLRLAYLTVQLLRHRIELDWLRQHSHRSPTTTGDSLSSHAHSNRHRKDGPRTTTGTAATRPSNTNSATATCTANCYSSVRRTAEDVVLLIRDLRDRQLGDFWLSVAAFTFPSTVTFLLRCAVEGGYGPSSSSSASFSNSSSNPLRLARDLVQALRRHRDISGWDLGEICLAQLGDVVDRVWEISMQQQQQQGADKGEEGDDGDDWEEGKGEGSRREHREGGIDGEEKRDEDGRGKGNGHGYGNKERGYGEQNHDDHDDEQRPRKRQKMQQQQEQQDWGIAEVPGERVAGVSGGNYGGFGYGYGGNGSAGISGGATAQSGLATTTAGVGGGGLMDEDGMMMYGGMMMMPDATFLDDLFPSLWDAFRPGT